MALRLRLKATSLSILEMAIVVRLEVTTNSKTMRIKRAKIKT